MPSASAKIEKVASVEAVDPVKQMVILMEKKVRNLEKRKLKLDNYKSDVQNGKELNEDQKIAVSKYDAVVELLEFAKELSKSCGGIIQEFARQQKKLAKKEQIEKQQHEIHRLHEVFSIKYLLERLECKDVNMDFLNGENGALKLTSEELTHLSLLYKLIESNLPNEQADVESHFHSLAEHIVFLLEGKNKEVVGTTYKNLKELLQNIKDCGYFSRTSTEEEDEEEEEEEEEETAAVVESVSGLDDDLNVPDSVDVLGALSNPVELSPVSCEINACILTDTDKIQSDENIESTVEKVVLDKPIVLRNSSYSVQNGPLQEVLSSEGSFNFLQESQIDLESPHMDPAVVAVHQMAPPPGVNFSSYTPPQPHLDEEMSSSNVDPCEVQAVQQQLPVLSSTGRSIAPLLTSVQHSTPHDFDPSHPIPTQTFTNQSYAVMQNMIMPSAYVPVTMHHGPIPPHIAPIAVVTGLPSATGSVTTTAAVPLHVTVASVPITTTVPTMALANEESKMTMENFESQRAAISGSTSGNETDGSQSEALVDRGVSDSEGFTTLNNYRGGVGSGGGFRARGRGRVPYRGRNNYNPRGGYQGHNNYYQNGNGFRRGSPRGGPRGPINSRGRGNAYRSQSSQQQQSQQHTQKQQ